MLKQFAGSKTEIMAAIYVVLAEVSKQIAPDWQHWPLILTIAGILAGGAAADRIRKAVGK